LARKNVMLKQIKFQN